MIILKVMARQMNNVKEKFNEVNLNDGGIVHEIF